MTYQRIYEIERGLSLLSSLEMEEGWHFSYEWDGMLIHPSWPEAEGCGCDICKEYRG